ncbi:MULTISPECIES: hypothetical protein [Pseudoalteromonas]|uniref:DUF423 domain-containing protein n=1 Tax=Pseudoalteromonas amylolytica TaxID=1859457 RepID=A0A1S1MPD5_9GAMM|nr:MULTISPECIES: hypothetical protein [Pseudoalteromonas]OHU85028.1 hypothetical protein BFC16_20295 [Pseudoalteromonas sp. JW3]OHU90021.1 hypothetical protein BET10_14680 [Pseudoalteromonas amylolytica]
MNTLIFIAGVIGLITFCIHVFAGQIDPVRPFLNSNLADIPKATLLACWHMVSLTLLLGSLSLSYIGWHNLSTYNTVVMAMSISYMLFATVFIVVGWYFFSAKVFVKLPQWVLLLPIGLLSLARVHL